MSLCGCACMKNQGLCVYWCVCGGVEQELVSVHLCTGRDLCGCMHVCGNRDPVSARVCKCVRAGECVPLCMQVCVSRDLCIFVGEDVCGSKTYVSL